MKKSLDIPNAIRWHEGMLLAPQHFQQQTRRFEVLLHHYANMACPYFWGVSHIVIDEALLDDRTLRVTEIEAIMPDGMYVSGSLPDLDLAPFKSDAERNPVRVYLCVPDAAVADRQGVMARYLVDAGSSVSDEDPEADEGQVAVPIPRLKPNAQLIAGEAGTAGRVRMPIAEIEYVESAFRLTHYVPPHTKISRDPWCKNVMAACEEVAKKVRGKANYLLEMIRSPMGSSSRPQFERQLSSLLAGLPEFEAYLASGEMHPYQMYVSLCILASHVASVASLDEIPRFPRYDHENIAELFDSVGKGLNETLDLGVQESFTEFRLDGEGHHFQIPFREEWVGHKLVLGFLGEPAPEIINWAEDCYIGTDSHIDAMSKNRDIGARRVRDDQHEGLRRRPGTVLYTLGEDLRRIEPGETMHVFNPVMGSNDVAPNRVLLYVKHAAN